MSSKHDVVGAVSDSNVATEPRAVVDALRAVIAGSGATHLIGPAVTLFEAGGKLLLDEASRNTLRSAAEKGAERALAFAAGPLLGPATAMAQRPIALLTKASKTARSIAPAAAKSASKEIFKGAGRAAGIGFVLDGAIAGVEAAVAVRNGSMDRKGAATYVAKEAATGAIATGAGVLLGASLVAVTGGVAAPVVFAVGALGSIGTRRLLRHVTDRSSRELTVRRLEAKIT